METTFAQHMMTNYWFLDEVLMPLLMTLTLLFFTNLMANLRFKREANAKIFHSLQRLGTAMTRIGHIDTGWSDYQMRYEVLRNTIEDFHGASIKNSYKPNDPFTVAFGSIERLAEDIQKGGGRYKFKASGVNDWAAELLDKYFKVDRLPLWKLLFTPR